MKRESGQQSKPLKLVFDHLTAEFFDQALDFELVVCGWPETLENLRCSFHY